MRHNWRREKAGGAWAGASCDGIDDMVHHAPRRRYQLAVERGGMVIRCNARPGARAALLSKDGRAEVGSQRSRHGLNERS